MQSANTRLISVLLTKPPDRLSSFFRLISGCEYSHVSLGIEEYNDRFFSFNIKKKGFAVERPMKSKNLKKITAPCLLYHLEVCEEVYANIKNRLREFDNSSLLYNYSFLGVLLCFLGIAYRRKHSYFCSQFVSELISLSGAAKLRKHPSLYLPKDFIEEPSFRLCYQGPLMGLYQYV